MPNTADSGATFPTLPRFTLDALREIRIATGDGESTIASYTYTIKGKPYTKYAAYDDLSKAEREAALTFILKFSGAARIHRKGKPRGRAVPGKRKRPAPPLESIELEPIDLDSLEAPAMPPLEHIEGGGEKP